MTIRRRVPFAQIPEWIIKAEISSHAKVLWAALDRFAGLPHGAIPSRAMLAREWLHVSVFTLDRAKAELLEIGALTLEKSPGHTDTYMLEEAPTISTDANTISAPVQIPPSAPVLNEREIVEREQEKERTPSTALAVRSEVWDALVAATGITPETHGERSKFGKSTSELLAVGATPDEIALRASRWPERFPDATLTDRALVNHWGALSNGAPRRHRRKYGTGVTPGEIGDMVKQLKEQGR